MLGVALGAFAPVARRLAGALRRDRASPACTSASTTRAGRCCARPSTTPRRCSPSSRCPTPTSIVARNVLDEHQAGLYAGGLILTKAVLFLPAVRGGGRVPVDVDGSERRPRALPRASAACSALGVGRRRWRRAAAPARAGLRRRPGVRRDPGPAVGVRGRSAPCWRCSSCWSTPCWPGRRAALGATWSGSRSSLLIVRRARSSTPSTQLLTVVLVVDAAAVRWCCWRCSLRRPRQPTAPAADAAATG